MDVVRKKQKTETVRVGELNPLDEFFVWSTKYTKIKKVPVSDVDGAFWTAWNSESGALTAILDDRIVTPVNPIKQEPETIAWEDRDERLFFFQSLGNENVWVSFCRTDRGQEFVANVVGDTEIQIYGSTRITIIEGTFVQKGAAFHQEEC